MHVTAVGTALPPYAYDQEALCAALGTLWPGKAPDLARLETLHRSSCVARRATALPVEELARLRTFGEANDAWIRVGLDLGEEAVRTALDGAGLTPRDVDQLVFVSVTGIANPSLDARLANRLGLRADVKRIPIFGLGCVGGAAGLARNADYLRAFPGHVALLLSVELCSLTWQHHDHSTANLISAALFADGAAAVVAVGAERDAVGPRIVATRSVQYPDTEHVMGWHIGEHGFRVVLTPEVPEVAERALPPVVDAFLAEHGLTRADMGVWVAHPGGPRVLEAMQRGLGLPEGAFARSWESLRDVGNLSSASVLFVLAATLADPPPPGTWGLLVAMGPGFCSELVLLRW